MSRNGSGPRVLHITPSLSAEWGGTTSAVLELTGALGRRGLSVVIAATALREEMASLVVPVGVETKVFPASSAAGWRYSTALKRYLREHLQDFDVVHLHGLWLYPTFVGARMAARTNVPYVLTPHGMLSDWALEYKSWKKRIYLPLIERRTLARAAIVHAITPLEERQIRRVVKPRGLEVVPNGIDLQQPGIGGESCRLPGAQLERTIVFLGRIHRIKAIDRLIEAFINAEDSAGFRLVIAGPPEDPEYLNELRDLAANAHNADRIAFTGPVYGAEKWAFLRRAWALVLPSYSEVVGMVNLEAAACYTPTITTRETGLLDWEEGGGLLVSAADDTRQLANALGATMRWSIEEREKRGLMSRALVERRYSMAAVSERWVRIYSDAAPFRDGEKR